MRLDVCLVERALAKSRTLSARLIEAGKVRVNGAVVKKPSFFVTETDDVCVEENDLTRFVSRGGLKLSCALDAFGVEVKGKRAFDFGASTGGFTDCLLQRGVSFVTSVDVGTAQMDERISSDGRVRLLEQTDARTVTEEITGLCELGVMDVSFISQSLLYPAAARCLKDGGDFVTLYKPQFEVGRAHLNKNGIVKEGRHIDDARERLIAEASRMGLVFVASVASPIPGGDGNYEELLHFVRKEHV